MIFCNVTGIISAGPRLSGLEGLSFVTVCAENGVPFAAADRLGAATGQQVLVCQGPGAQAVLCGRCPLDAAVIAIVQP